MRVLWTLGPLTILDITLFQVSEHKNPDVVVVHHYKDDESDKDEDGPSEGPDLFGGQS